MELELIGFDLVLVFRGTVSLVSTANDMILDTIANIDVLLAVVMATDIGRDTVVAKIWKNIWLQLLRRTVLGDGIYWVMASYNQVISRALAQGLFKPFQLLSRSCCVQRPREIRTFHKMFMIADA